MASPDGDDNASSRSAGVLFAYSAVAIKHASDRLTEIDHTTGTLEAGSKREALDVAEQLAYRHFPESRGWANHSAVVRECDVPMTIEGATDLTDEEPYDGLR